MTPRTYGWRPDKPDFRDRYRIVRPAIGQTLPKQVDLSGNMPAVYDQGSLGSCTGNALAAAFDFERKRQGMNFVNPSRLFIYYNEREIEGTISTDAGAEIRDGITAINKQGVCPESEWRYNVTQFAVAPPARCYTDALADRALSCQRIAQTVTDTRTVLAGGLCFPFGFTVYESFESDTVTQTGMVPMPGTREKVLGGHAAVAVGYDDETNRFLVRNSWGIEWGRSGYFWLPYDYLLNSDLAADLWEITMVGK